LKAGQEQGLYYPNEFDKAFTILSSMTKEKVKKWSIIDCLLWKGYYIYTGLSLFRELPEEFLVHIEY
jgi:hypothetical protein